METIFTYFLKSSGLIMTFFIAYYFLLRKETFFTTNRWFLLSGLISSVVLPLFFIKKVVLVDAAKIVPYQGVVTDAIPVSNTEIIEKTIEINWLQVGFYIYGIIAAVLLLKIILDLISLYKVVHKSKIQQQQNFQFIDVKENVSPFSFFNYIVINSSLYSESELKSILLHEKIHSSQKHSLDVLITNLFAVIFWFNPFMHLYKKAVLQNLEYIADSEAIAQIEDRKSYQMALLKVISNQNCLPITNHFYQSLIKKRIVMLNKNQSHRKNSWKYAAILPALIAFVILFQVKVIAQEKERKETSIKEAFAELSSFTIDKNSTDAEIKKEAEILKKQSGIEIKFSKIKRNADGEIIAIKIDYKDNNGHKGTSYTNGDTPISPITIFKTKNSIGIRSSETSTYSKQTAITTNDESAVLDADELAEVAEASSIAMDMANFPTPPTPPNPPAIPAVVLNMNSPQLNFPTAPIAPKGTPITNEKEWKKFEKKMEEFGKKMDAMSPQIEAYALKMANYEEQMKPYEKEMEAYEKKMEAYEKQMEAYEKQIEKYYQKTEK